MARNISLFIELWRGGGGGGGGGVGDHHSMAVNRSVHIKFYCKGNKMGNGSLAFQFRICTFLHFSIDFLFYFCLYFYLYFLYFYLYLLYFFDLLSRTLVCSMCSTCAKKLVYRTAFSIAKRLERLTAKVVVSTVLGSIPASSDTMESEGRQMKQC
jgi:hypothetical protein